MYFIWENTFAGKKWGDFEVFKIIKDIFKKNYNILFKLIIIKYYIITNIIKV